MKKNPKTRIERVETLVETLSQWIEAWWFKLGLGLVILGFAGILVTYFAGIIQWSDNDYFSWIVVGGLSLITLYYVGTVLGVVFGLLYMWVYYKKHPPVSDDDE